MTDLARKNSQPQMKHKPLAYNLSVKEFAKFSKGKSSYTSVLESYTMPDSNNLIYRKDRY